MQNKDIRHCRYLKTGLRESIYVIKYRHLYLSISSPHLRHCNCNFDISGRHLGSVHEPLRDVDVVPRWYQLKSFGRKLMYHQLQDVQQRMLSMTMATTYCDVCQWSDMKISQFYIFAVLYTRTGAHAFPVHRECSIAMSQRYSWLWDAVSATALFLPDY